MKHQLEELHNFKEAGDRIVAMVGLFDSRVAVYENGKLLHTCKNEYSNSNTLLVNGRKAYFASSENELVELDLERFKERPILANVFLFSGIPGERSFVAVSWTGIVHASDGRTLNLEELFKQMKECDWRSVVSLGRFAVVAGSSEHSILDGSKLEKNHNYFLLINLADFTVVNQNLPLALEFNAKSIRWSNCLRGRADQHHAML